MKIFKFLLLIVVILKDAFAVDPSVISFDERLDLLKRGIPAVGDSPERGRMVKCREGMLPVVRLNRWAGFLAPKTKSESIKIDKLLRSSVPELRYIAAKSILLSKGVNRDKIPKEISVYDALQPQDSENYLSLVNFLRRLN